jgi:hypothetical protein
MDPFRAEAYRTARDATADEPGRHAEPHAGTYLFPDARPERERHAHTSADIDADAHADALAQSNGHPHTDTNTNADAQADVGPRRHSNGVAHPQAHAVPHTNADACRQHPLSAQ